jgi:hypothetical protein
MTSQALFIELMHRLRHYNDAAVLWVLLKKEADVFEYTTTAAKIVLDQLPAVKRWDVQRSIARLHAKRLLQARIQPNTSTSVTINREAVLRLLRDPMPQCLPGLDQETFSFLAAWKESTAPTMVPAQSAFTAAEIAAVPKLPQGVEGDVVQDPSA